MFGIGPMELMAILVVALLVFGPKRIPELARTVGRGLAEFRRASNDLRQSLALDELQNDLRRDLDPNRTIHRPEDRPAQAGDDDALPKKSGDDQDEPTAEEVAAESSDASDPHPGELPMGEEHDFAHRDPVDAGEKAGEIVDRSAGAGATPPTNSEPAADSSPPSSSSTKPPTQPAQATKMTPPTTTTDDPSAEPASSPRHETQSADSELGNVPVSGTKSTDSRRG